MFTLIYLLVGLGFGLYWNKHLLAKDPIPMMITIRNIIVHTLAWPLFIMLIVLLKEK